MNQVKFYKIAIWILLFLNILAIGLLLLSINTTHPSIPPRDHNLQKEIVRILNLDDAQQAKFYALAKQHEMQIRLINDQEHQLLLPYFENIGKGVESEDTANNALVLSQAQELNRKKLVLTRQHFIEIKSLLNDTQLDDFKELMKIVSTRIVIGKKKNPPPPQDF